MSRKCAVCGGETTILKNEHNRVVDFRLCGGECREKWFKWNKACKAQAIDVSSMYPTIMKGRPNKNIIVYDEYLDTDMLDSGDIVEKVSNEAKDSMKRIMINLYGKRL